MSTELQLDDIRLRDWPELSDLYGLYLFACEGENVGKAAVRLGIKEPAMAKRLSHFRRMGDRDGRFDEALIEGTKNKTWLTEKAWRIMPVLQEVLRRFEHVQGHVLGKSAEPSVLTVATGSAASQWYLPAAIAGMQQRHPHCRIRAEVTRGQARIRGVISGAFDLAVVTHDSSQIAGLDREHALDVVLLDSQPICVIAKKGSAAAQLIKKILASHRFPAANLDQWPLSGLDEKSGLRQQVVHELRRLGKEAQFGHQAGGWLAIKAYAQHGLGVGILPLASVSPGDNDLEVRLLSDEIRLTHYLVYRRDAITGGKDDLVSAMKQALLDAAQQQAERLRRNWHGKLPL